MRPYRAATAPPAMRPSPSLPGSRVAMRALRQRRSYRGAMPKLQTVSRDHTAAEPRKKALLKPPKTLPISRSAQAHQGCAIPVLALWREHPLHGAFGGYSMRQVDLFPPYPSDVGFGRVLSLLRP